MAEPFVTTFGEVEASALKQEIIELLEVKLPGWEPSSGDLLAWLAEGKARIDAEVFEQMTDLEQAAFKRFGEAIVSLPPIQAAAATVASVWTMADELGHEIPAGTLVGIPGPEGRPLGFETVGDVVVPPGSTKAAILLEAIEAGEAGNGLSGEPQLETQLAFVEAPGGVELEGVTSGGVDEEEEDAYLNRLVEELRTLSLSLIKAADFEIDARSIAGIARAKCIEAYNAEEEKEEALAVSVWPIDEAGKGSSAPVKEELEARQKGKLLSGVNYYVGVPTYTTVDVLAQVVPQVGFDPPTVVAAVIARLAEYLDPGLWGLPPLGDSGGGWENRTTVYYNEVISEIDRVGGVDRVASVWLGGSGGGKSFTVEAATDVFTTSVAHGYEEGDAVLFREGLAGSAPAAQETLYYVRDLTTTTFKIALSPGGAAVNITTDGSGVVVRMKQADTALNGILALPTPKTLAVSAI